MPNLTTLRARNLLKKGVFLHVLILVYRLAEAGPVLT
jgi:hypothetical protein